MWPSKPQEHTVGSAVVKQGGCEDNEKSPEAVLRLVPFVHPGAFRGQKPVPSGN